MQFAIMVARIMYSNGVRVLRNLQVSIHAGTKHTFKTRQRHRDMKSNESYLKLLTTTTGNTLSATEVWFWVGGLEIAEADPLHSRKFCCSCINGKCQPLVSVSHFQKKKLHSTMPGEIH